MPFLIMQMWFVLFNLQPKLGKVAERESFFLPTSLDPAYFRFRLL